MNTHWKGHALVLLQVTGIGVTVLGYFFSEMPTRAFLSISVIGIIFGIFTLLHNRPGNFSVHPTPLNHSTLITTGPYQLVRHPMYVCVILVLLGIALTAGTLIGWLGFTAGALAVIGKSYLEEGYLIEKHPEYKAYKKQVKRLIPFVW